MIVSTAKCAIEIIQFELQNQGNILSGFFPCDRKLLNRCSTTVRELFAGMASMMKVCSGDAGCSVAPEDSRMSLQRRSEGRSCENISRTRLYSSMSSTMAEPLQISLTLLIMDAGLSHIGFSALPVLFVIVITSLTVSHCNHPLWSSRLKHISLTRFGREYSTRLGLEGA